MLCGLYCMSKTVTGKIILCSNQWKQTFFNKTAKLKINTIKMKLTMTNLYLEI